MMRIAMCLAVVLSATIFTAGPFPAPALEGQTRREPDRDVDVEPIEVDGEDGTLEAEIAVHEIDPDLDEAIWPEDDYDIVAVFVPATGAFWWTLTHDDDRIRIDEPEFYQHYWRFGMAGDRLVSFRALPRTVAYRESSEVAASMDEGVSRAIARLRSEFTPEKLRREHHEWTIHVSSLPDAFLWTEGPTAVYAPVRVAWASPSTKGLWNIVLESAKGERARVVVDSVFREQSVALSKVRLLTPEPRSHSAAYYSERVAFGTVESELLTTRNWRTAAAYWWHVRPVGVPDDAGPGFALYYAADRAIGVRIDGRQLGVREVRGRLRGHTAVREHALAEWEQRGGLAAAGELVRSSDLPAFVPPSPAPELRAIRRFGDRWEVTLGLPDRDVAVLTLDADLRIGNARRARARVIPVDIHTAAGVKQGWAAEREVMVMNRGREDSGVWRGIYDPESRLVMSLVSADHGQRSRSINALENIIGYLTFASARSSLFGFTASRAWLFVRQSNARASSLDDAIAGAEAAAAGWKGEAGDGTEIDLTHLGDDFARTPGAAMTMEQPRIERIAPRPTGWDVSVKGLNGTRVMVRLDPALRLAGTDVLPLASPVPVDITASSGPVAAQLNAHPVSLRLADGARRPSHVYGIFEPTSGAFWWVPIVGDRSAISTEHMERFGSGTVVVKDGPRMVGFAIKDGQLGVRDVSAVAPSLEQGLAQVVKALEARVASQQEATDGRMGWYARVDVGSIADKFTEKNQFFTNYARIESAARIPAGWRLTVALASRGTATLTLDESFKLTGATLPQ